MEKVKEPKPKRKRRTAAQILADKMFEIQNPTKDIPLLKTTSPEPNLEAREGIPDDHEPKFEIFTAWINIQKYQRGRKFGYYTGGDLHETYEDARKMANQLTCDTIMVRFVR
jgi:hypothetical protein